MHLLNIYPRFYCRYNVLVHYAPNPELSAMRLSSAARAIAPKGIDVDILEQLYRTHVGRFQLGDLNSLMNGVIKTKLGVIPAGVSWGGQSDQVFSAQSVAFMQVSHQYAVSWGISRGYGRDSPCE